MFVVGVCAALGAAAWMLVMGVFGGGGMAEQSDIEPLERYVCAQDEEQAEEFDIECEED